ncbi:hypothetical protein N566_10690 [Streptomycetaceae bacterium MP113-05]|nr:hypothetical protein N566_10690 [Streptomycetaceae bacterium MP113-05]
MHASRNAFVSRPSPTPRRPAVAVMLLVAASAAALATHLAVADDTFQDCRYLGPSTRMYLTAFAVPLCAVAALLVCLALNRSSRARGRRLAADLPGSLAAATVTLAPVLMLIGCVLVHWVFAPDPSGGADCSGLGPHTLPG